MVVVLAHDLEEEVERAYFRVKPDPRGPWAHRPRAGEVVDGYDGNDGSGAALRAEGRRWFPRRRKTEVRVPGGRSAYRSVAK